MSPSQNASEAPKLIEFPVDILLELFKKCDIDTLLTSRLICKSTNAVIEEHIRVIAPAVATNAFPFYAACHLGPANPDGYALGWLRDLIPNQLASIAADKDKLRRHPYFARGYPYGVPAENVCPEAINMRAVIATGWRVLRRFSLISQEIYSLDKDSLKKSYRSCSKKWKLPSLSKMRKKDRFAAVRRREEIILQHRITLLSKLSITEIVASRDLTRILQCCFRPYCKPGTTSTEAQSQWDKHTDQPGVVINWNLMFSCDMYYTSWLNWFVLSAGPTMFLDQWSANRTSEPYRNIIRDEIWRAYSARTIQQHGIESDYASAFERHLAERHRELAMQLVEEGIVRPGYPGANTFFHAPASSRFSIDYTSLYDQTLVLARSPIVGFPWYDASKHLWAIDDYFMKLRAPSTAGGVDVRLVKRPEGDDEQDDERWEKGLLEHVSYLCYLGVVEADGVWPGVASGLRTTFEF